MAILPRVWVTRTEPGATRTAERVRALGLTPVVQPLLAVRYIDAAINLNGVGALAFTSRNGVEGFARRHAGRSLPVFAVGDATAEAAREQGFDRVVSADGDLEALATLLRRAHAAEDGILLHPGPARPAGDLAALAGTAIVVRSVVVYSTEPTPDPAPPFDIVLIHSPRAATRLAETSGGVDVSALTAVAISPAAAQPVEALGFGRLIVADRPDEPAMMAALGKAARRV